MKFLTVFLLTLSLVSLVYSYTYTVIVQTGKQDFKTVDGSIKLKVHGIHSTDTFRLIQDDLKPDKTYTRYLEMNYEIDEIDKASLYWTLTNPAKNPGSIFKKPVIYVKKIVLIDHNGRQKGLAFPNPASPIKLKEERSLIRV